MPQHQKAGPSWAVLRDWLSVAYDESDVNAALARFAKEHGFRWFTYLWLQDANVRGISNYPVEWQKHYLSNRLAFVDPVLHLARHAKGAFAWPNATPAPARSRQQYQFMRDAALLGIRFGYTIPIEGGYGTRAALTFSGPEPQGHTTIADQFYALSMGAFLHGYLERSSIVQFKAGDCPLTTYQLECLSWLVQGKSNAEIATIRGVSTRAVELQISAVKQKLGTVSTIQSVAVAVQRQWILA
jgi:LuxR family transcriptional regulator, activator of conjugal transfer of Ti plasmids